MTDAIAAYLGLGGFPGDGADLTKIERLAAAIDSACYLNAEMDGCPRYANSIALLTAAMRARALTQGLILEFGVYSGHTINHLAGLDPRPIFGFDSFEGLPEDWRDDFKKGAFGNAALPAVADNIQLVAGWFENTLPGFLATHSGNVSFLHVDCDLYSSTRTVFHHLAGRIVPGTVIVFDEYFNYVGWRKHEFKAFAEFIAASGLRYRYIGVVPSHQQAGVIIV